MLTWNKDFWVTNKHLSGGSVNASASYLYSRIKKNTIMLLSIIVFFILKQQQGLL